MSTHQFWSGQCCWNRFQRLCSIQTCLDQYQYSKLWTLKFIFGRRTYFHLQFLAYQKPVKNRQLYLTYVGHSLLSLQGDFETTCVSSPGDISKAFLQNLLTFFFAFILPKNCHQFMFSKFYEFVIGFMYTAMEMYVSP